MLVRRALALAALALTLSISSSAVAQEATPVSDQAIRM